MHIFRLMSISFMLISFPILAQDNLHQSIIIDSELINNANAVVRLNDIKIEILAYNKMLVKKRRIITILNESGERKANINLHYDNTISIKKLEAKIYNNLGEEIKKIKKSGFKDVSAVDGFSFYLDDRIKHLSYTPSSYPYTIDYIEETVRSTTAFIPQWYPIEAYYVSTETSSYSIVNNTDINITTKTSNFEAYAIEDLGDNNFSAKHLKAVKPEEYSPSFSEIVPNVKAALSEFDMKGVRGVNTSWKDFGKWMYNDLIKDTQVLPDETKNKIKELTKSASTDIEKAKIVYAFMQNKTRYISVQVGIGGWKPMQASDVDRLGYGDCKALTNYTKTLLDEVGVNSYYTVIYGDKHIKNIDKEFSVTEGNHVILCIPNDDDYIWLECTSQTEPFGHNANGTDDRDALIITPEGGEIVHTRVYSTEENKQTIQANIKLSGIGDIEAKVEITSEGAQYDYHESLLRKELKNQKLYYKNHFNYINNLDIENIQLNNNKDAVIFTENINLKASKYMTKAGNRMLFIPNLFNRVTDIPSRYADRKLPVEIDRGFTHEDTYSITLPDNVEVEALQEDMVLDTKFGSYTYTIKQLSDNRLEVTRKLIFNKGKFLKEDYKTFRKFLLDINKFDKSKIVLKITS